MEGKEITFFLFPCKREKLLSIVENYKYIEINEKQSRRGVAYTYITICLKATDNSAQP